MSFGVVNAMADQLGSEVTNGDMRGKAWTCLRQERVCDAQQLAGHRTRGREMLGPPGRSDVAAAHRAALRELRRGKKGRAST